MNNNIKNLNELVNNISNNIKQAINGLNNQEEAILYKDYCQLLEENYLKLQYEVMPQLKA